MNRFQVLSLLLDYPGDGFERALAEVPRDGVEAFVEACAALPLAELQAEYVQAFDFDRRASLHLTYHVHGDRRQRGVELVRLKRRFAAAGLALAEGELPDYLPVLLEFAALEPEEGTALLAEHRPALELVRAALHERGSRYAPLLDALCACLPPLTRAQAERARRLAEQGPPVELVGLDSVATVPAEVAR